MAAAVVGGGQLLLEAAEAGVEERLSKQLRMMDALVEVREQVDIEHIEHRSR